MTSPVAVSLAKNCTESPGVSSASKSFNAGWSTWPAAWSGKGAAGGSKKACVKVQIGIRHRTHCLKRLLPFPALDQVGQDRLQQNGALFRCRVSRIRDIRIIGGLQFRIAGEERVD